MRIMQLFPKLYLYLITNSTLYRLHLTKFNRSYKRCSQAKPLGLIPLTADFLKSLLSPYFFLCRIFSIICCLLVSSLAYGNWQMLHQFIKTTTPLMYLTIDISLFSVPSAKSLKKQCINTSLISSVIMRPSQHFTIRFYS